MKKLAIILASVLILASCGKAGGNFLAGSSYRTSGYALMGYIFGTYYHVLEFHQGGKGIAYWTGKDGVQNDTDGEFTYRVNYPDLYISIKGREEEHYTFDTERSFILVKVDGTLNKSFTYYKL